MIDNFGEHFGNFTKKIEDNIGAVVDGITDAIDSIMAMKTAFQAAAVGMAIGGAAGWFFGVPFLGAMIGAGIGFTGGDLGIFGGDDRQASAGVDYNIVNNDPLALDRGQKSGDGDDNLRKLDDRTFERIANMQSGGITTQEGTVNLHPQEAIIPLSKLTNMFAELKEEIHGLRMDNKKFLGPGGNQEQALNKVAKAL